MRSEKPTHSATKSTRFLVSSLSRLDGNSHRGIAVHLSFLFQLQFVQVSPYASEHFLNIRPILCGYFEILDGACLDFNLVDVSGAALTLEITLISN